MDANNIITFFTKIFDKLSEGLSKKQQAALAILIVTSLCIALIVSVFEEHRLIVLAVSLVTLLFFAGAYIILDEKYKKNREKIKTLGQKNVDLDSDLRKNKEDIISLAKSIEPKIRRLDKFIKNSRSNQKKISEDDLKNLEILLDDVIEFHANILKVYSVQTNDLITLDQKTRARKKSREFYKKD